MHPHQSPASFGLDFFGEGPSPIGSSLGTSGSIILGPATSSGASFDFPTGIGPFSADSPPSTSSHSLSASVPPGGAGGKNRLEIVR